MSMKKWLKIIQNLFQAKKNTAEPIPKQKENDPLLNELKALDLQLDDLYRTDSAYHDDTNDDEPDFDIDFEKAAIYDDPFDGAAIQIPIEDFIDLHTFAPDESRQVLDAYIEAAREKGYKQVRIIHGKGIGVQKQIVQSHLKQHYAVESYRIGRPEEGGQGVTIAYLK